MTMHILINNNTTRNDLNSEFNTLNHYKKQYDAGKGKIPVGHIECQLGDVVLTKDTAEVIIQLLQRFESVKLIIVTSQSIEPLIKEISEANLSNLENLYLDLQFLDKYDGSGPTSEEKIIESFAQAQMDNLQFLKIPVTTNLSDLVTNKPNLKKVLITKIYSQEDFEIIKNNIENQLNNIDYFISPHSFTIEPGQMSNLDNLHIINNTGTSPDNSLLFPE